MPWCVCVDPHYRYITLSAAQDVSFQGRKLWFHTGFGTGGRVISPGFCHTVRGASLCSCQTPEGKRKSAGGKKSLSLQEQNMQTARFQHAIHPPRPEVMPLSHGTNKILSPLLNHDKGWNITASDPFTPSLHFAPCSRLSTRMDTIHPMSYVQKNDITLFSSHG